MRVDPRLVFTVLLAGVPAAFAAEGEVCGDAPPVTRPAEVERLRLRVFNERAAVQVGLLIPGGGALQSLLGAANEGGMQKAREEVGHAVAAISRQARRLRNDKDVEKYVGAISVDDQGTAVTYAHLADFFKEKGEPPFAEAEGLGNLLTNKSYRPPQACDDFRDNPNDPDDPYKTPPDEFYDRLRYMDRSGECLFHRVRGVAEGLNATANATDEEQSQSEGHHTPGFARSLFARLRTYFGTQSLPDCIEPEGYIPPMAQLAAMFARNTRIGSGDGPPGRAQLVYDQLKAKRDAYPPTHTAYYAINNIMDQFQAAVMEDNRRFARAQDLLTPPYDKSPRAKVAAKNAKERTKRLEKRTDKHVATVQRLIGTMEDMTFAANAQTEAGSAHQELGDARNFLAGADVLIDLAADGGGPAASAGGACKLIEGVSAFLEAKISLRQATARLREVQRLHQRFMQEWRDSCRDHQAEGTNPNSGGGGGGSGGSVTHEPGQGGGSGQSAASMCPSGQTAVATNNAFEPYQCVPSAP